MKRQPLKILIAGVAVAAAIGGAYLLAFARPLRVPVVRPARDVPVRVFGLGTVEARVLSRVGFEVGATLVELLADHGDRVGEGAVLARLDDAEQRARASEAEAGVAHAEAAVEAATAAVERAGAVLAQRERTNRRQQRLRAEHTVSDESADQAELDARVAAAELAITRAEVEVARAALADARARAAFERARLDHHVLRAPYDALVIERHRELGSVLSPGETLFTLVAVHTVWVLAYVDEARAGDLRVGQSAEIRLRSQPRESFAGTVARIGIESDRVSEERRVYVAFAEPPASFHLGEQAEVLVETARLGEALLVPATAVEGFDGAHGRVWTIEQGRLQTRSVTFGSRTLDAEWEILDGLPEGAAVLATRAPGAREGRRALARGEGES